MRRKIKKVVALLSRIPLYFVDKKDKVMAFIKSKNPPVTSYDWRDEFEYEHELQYPMHGHRSLLKWKNLKSRLLEEQEDWWDFVPPRVPPKQYRKIKCNTSDRPIKDLLSSELYPPESHDMTIQFHKTLVFLERPLQIDLHKEILEGLNAKDEEDEEEYLSPLEDDEEYLTADEE